jgi:type II secretory pathway pseudopilin PulG
MFQRIRNKMTREDGFTVVEFSIVTVLVSGLGAAAIVSLAGQTAKASDVACKANVKAVMAAQVAYYDQTSRYATTTLVLKNAGLLQTEPPAGQVTLNADEPNSAPAMGSTTSRCAGFMG